MYNLENLSPEITRYLEAKRAYLNADFDSLSPAEIDVLRRQYDDAAHSVAFHARIVVESLSSLTSPASDASQFLIPAPDQAPNISKMFDEPELPAGGYDVCRDCGERRALDEFARCASCAAAKEGITDPLQRCIKNDPECPNPGWPFPCPKCNYCRQNPAELAQSDESQEEHTLYVADGDALYRLKVANGHVRVAKRQPAESQLTYELNVWGRPLHYDRYWDLAVIREVINRYDMDIIDHAPDENQDDASSDWLTAATDVSEIPF